MMHFFDWYFLPFFGSNLDCLQIKIFVPFWRFKFEFISYIWLKNLNEK